MVAVDDVGRRMATKTVRTDSDGHLDLVRWSTQFDDVVFALEDCRHLTRRLESDLLIAGWRVARRAAPRIGTAENLGRFTPPQRGLSIGLVSATLQHAYFRTRISSGPATSVGRAVAWSTVRPAPARDGRSRSGGPHSAWWILTEGRGDRHDGPSRSGVVWGGEGAPKGVDDAA